MNTHKRPFLIVDARLIKTSGIGTVIQNTLPYLLSYFKVTLLGYPEELKSFPWANKCSIINFKYPIYSLGEQIGFILKVPACDFFFSPHYNVPLTPIKAKKRITIIHDVNHIAFAGELGYIKKAYAQLVIASALKFSDKVFTVSYFSKSEILKYFKVKGNKISTLKLGVDKSAFHLYDSTAKKEVIQKYKLTPNFILYVGNVKPHKNLQVLVNAFGLFKKQHAGLNYKLLIVGKKDGFITKDNFIINLIANLNLTEDVIFTGFVKNEDLPVIYNLANLFVFPSLYEGFGLPPIEAMACGCPTIVSNTSSLPEVCRDAALYFDPTEPQMLCDKMYEVLSNTSLRQSLIEKGFALTQTYDWQNTAQQLVNHILED